MTTTTFMDSGLLPWTVSAPAGVVVTPKLDNGVATALDISIDYTADHLNGAGTLIPITFTGYPLFPLGHAPTSNETPGLELAPTTIEIKNDSGVLITGYEIGVENTYPAPMDTNNQHPHYVHFHEVTPTSLINAATGQPNATIKMSAPGTEANFTPGGIDLEDIPAPNEILAQGLIDPGATEKLVGGIDGGVILHSEDTVVGSGSFTLFFNVSNYATPPPTAPAGNFSPNPGDLTFTGVINPPTINPTVGLQPPRMMFIGNQTPL